VAKAPSPHASQLRDTLNQVCVDALRELVDKQPSTTAAELRALVDEHPALAELTLDELLGTVEPPAPTKKKKRRRPRMPAALRVRQPFIGQQLRSLRAQAKLSRAALTQKTGIDASSLVRLERGDNVRLTSFLPVVEYFLAREPQAWMLAERLVLLDPQQRDELLASLDALESA